MKVLVCEDADWLLSEEAFSIYDSCMYHPTYEDYKVQISCLNLMKGIFMDWMNWRLTEYERAGYFT